MRARLMFNPKAGGGKHDVDELVARLRGANFDVLYSPEESRDAVVRWAREPVDVIVAAGGDGTVARAARALAFERPALAILPLGTANNIARTLGLTGHLSDVLEGLTHPHKRRLDIGLATGPWGERRFVEACGVGLFQHAIEHDTSSKDKRLSRARRLLLAKLEAGHRPTAWELELDGVRRSSELLLLEVMLGRSIGPRLRFAPNADPFDGLFDVVLAHATDGPRLVRYLKALLDGDEDAVPDLEVVRARRLSMHNMHVAGNSVRVDDNVVRPDLETLRDARFEVLPGAVEVWLPPKGTAPRPERHDERHRDERHHDERRHKAAK